MLINKSINSSWLYLFKLKLEQMRIKVILIEITLRQLQTGIDQKQFGNNRNHTGTCQFQIDNKQDRLCYCQYSMQILEKIVHGNVGEINIDIYARFIAHI